MVTCTPRLANINMNPNIITAAIRRFLHPSSISRMTALRDLNSDTI